MVQPDDACRNLQRMTDAGFAGRYGMYEAVDYTPQRLPPGQDHAVIASYMVHHQSMGLLALDHLLGGQPMQTRFAGDPALQATMLLLQERVPQTGVLHVSRPATPPATSPGSDGTDDDGRLRVFPTAASARPAVQLLSNGRYHVMVTNAGGGYSRRGDLDPLASRRNPRRHRDVLLPARHRPRRHLVDDLPADSRDGRRLSSDLFRRQPSSAAPGTG